MKTNTFALVLVLVGTSACKTTSTESAPLSSSAEAVSAATLPDNTQEQGRELTALFYKGEVAPIWSRMTDEMRNALGSEQKFAAFRQQLDGQLGVETKTIEEKVTASPPYQVYLRTASFSKYAKPVFVQWALDNNGKIAGFFIRPAG